MTGRRTSSIRSTKSAVVQLDGAYVGIPYQIEDENQPTSSLPSIFRSKRYGDEKKKKKKNDDSNNDEEFQRELSLTTERSGNTESTTTAMDVITTTEKTRDCTILVKVPRASYFISAIHILTFIVMTAIYGFAPLSENFCIGPDILDFLHLFDLNDHYDSSCFNDVWYYFCTLKQSKFCLVLLSNFMSVGIIPLATCTLINIQLGYHLEVERRWGSRRWLFVYLLHGIGSKAILMAINPDNFLVLYMALGQTLDAIIGIMLSELLYLQLYHPTANARRNDSSRLGEDTKEGFNFRFAYLSTLVLMSVAQVTYFSSFTLSVSLLIFLLKCIFVVLFLYDKYLFIKSKSARS